MAVLNHLHGETWLMANLLYGSGLRLMECVRLRVKDVDFAQKQIIVREGKGNKDRVTVLPKTLIIPLEQQLERAKAMREGDAHIISFKTAGRLYEFRFLARGFGVGAGASSGLGPRCQALSLQPLKAGRGVISCRGKRARPG